MEGEFSIILCKTLSIKQNAKQIIMVLFNAVDYGILLKYLTETVPEVWEVTEVPEGGAGWPAQHLGIQPVYPSGIGTVTHAALTSTWSQWVKLSQGIWAELSAYADNTQLCRTLLSDPKGTVDVLNRCLEGIMGWTNWSLTLISQKCWKVGHNLRLRRSYTRSRPRHVIWRYSWTQR